MADVIVAPMAVPTAGAASFPGICGGRAASEATASEEAPLPLPIHIDVARRIVDFCDIYDRAQLSMTCKAFHSHLKHEVKLARNAVRQFPYDPEMAMLRLTSLRFVPDSPYGIARFLYHSHGRLPAAAVGRYLTSPPVVDRDAQRAQAGALTIAFLRLFDFGYDSPVQALRKVLAHTRMPSGSKVASSFFKRIAYRYVECQQATLTDVGDGDDSADDAPARSAAPAAGGAAGVASVSACVSVTPPAPPVPRSATGDVVAGVAAGAASAPAAAGVAAVPPPAAPKAVSAAAASLKALASIEAAATAAAAAGVSASSTSVGGGAAASAAVSLPAAALMPPKGPPRKPRRLLYGFDPAMLDVDTAFVLIYSCIILNCDMRSSAVKAKMTRSDFVARNTDVAGLTHIPASFFGGLYDELAVQGLPVADHVSLEPARHAAPRQPAPEALAAIRHIVRSPAQTMRESAEYVRESAGQALSWLRRAVASLPVVQVPHAATVAVPALAAAGAVASPPTTGRSVAGSPSATHVP